MDKKSDGVSPPKKQDSKELEKFLEQSKKRRTEDTEENIKYKMPDLEGDASAKDLARQTQEILREKNASNTRHVDVEDE